MRFGSKTNPQKPSVTRLYYKAFAETKSCRHAAPRTTERKVEQRVHTLFRRKAVLRSTHRSGLGRSKTLLEYAHRRRQAYPRGTEAYTGSHRNMGRRTGPLLRRQAHRPGAGTEARVVGRHTLQVCPCASVSRAPHQAGPLPQERLRFRRQRRSQRCRSWTTWSNTPNGFPV